MPMKTPSLKLLPALLLGVTPLAHAAGYDILISKATHGKPEWAAVADALQKKHGPDSAILEYNESPAEALDQLRKDKPKYLCVVAEPTSLDRSFVVSLSRITRKIDDDIYGDCLWGIITGYEAADALRIANEKKPLVLQSGLHTTGCDHATLKRNMVISDGAKSRVETREGKEPRKDVIVPENDEGTVFEFLKRWNDARPDFMVTSSHATQYNLEMPFSRGVIVSYNNQFHALRQDQLQGFARFLGGAMFKGNENDMIAHCESLKAPVLGDRKGPGVWLGAGNCLLGDANRSRNSMVVTALSSGGFDQLVGYTVPSWYGRMGWGTLKTFTEQGDRLSLAEAFFLNNQDIVAETDQRFPKALAVEFNAPEVDPWLREEASMKPLAEAGYLTKELQKDALGLTHDRDVVAFYGDPAWHAGFAKPAHPKYLLEFTRSSASETVLTVKNPGQAEWKGNVFTLLPVRMNAPKCTEDSAKVTVADDFALLHDLVLKPGETQSIKISGAKS